jgi:hypothetical protein
VTPRELRLGVAELVLAVADIRFGVIEGMLFQAIQANSVWSSEDFDECLVAAIGAGFVWIDVKREHRLLKLTDRGRGLADMLLDIRARARKEAAQ